MIMQRVQMSLPITYVPFCGWRFWGGSENLLVNLSRNENRTFMVDADLADTTVQWVYWNNKGPAPFEPSALRLHLPCHL